MSKFGKLSRIACAIVDIILCIAMSMHYINEGKPTVIPLFAVIAIGTIIWLFDFVKSQKDTKLVAEANRFFVEFTKKQLLDDKQMDKTIANYYN